MKFISIFILTISILFSSCTSNNNEFEKNLLLEDAMAIESYITIYLKDTKNNSYEFTEAIENVLLNKINFISEDGSTVNQDLIGKKFKIIYTEEEGEITNEEGDLVNGIVLKLKSIELIK